MKSVTTLDFLDFAAYLLSLESFLLNQAKFSRFRRAYLQYKQILYFL